MKPIISVVTTGEAAPAPEAAVTVNKIVTYKTVIVVIVAVMVVVMVSKHFR